MSDTLIIGVITGTVALLSVGLNIFWMGKTFEQLSTALNQTREQLGKANEQTREQLGKANEQTREQLGRANDQTRDLIKDLAARMEKQFDRIDRRFETIEGDLKLFFKIQSEQAAALQALKERNDLK